MLEAQLRLLEQSTEGSLDDFEPSGEFNYSNEGYDLLSGNLLSTEWRQQMLSPRGEMPDLPGVTVHRGYGVYVAEWEGATRTVGKVGGIPGGSAQLELIPDPGYVVAVVSNFDRTATSVAFHIRELLTDM